MRTGRSRRDTEVRRECPHCKQSKPTELHSRSGRERSRKIHRSGTSHRLGVAVHDHILESEIAYARSRKLVLFHFYIEILKENIADLRLTGIRPDRAQSFEVTLDADQAQVPNHGFRRRLAPKIEVLRPR